MPLYQVENDKEFDTKCSPLGNKVGGGGGTSWNGTLGVYKN